MNTRFADKSTAELTVLVGNGVHTNRSFLLTSSNFRFLKCEKFVNLFVDIQKMADTDETKLIEFHEMGLDDRILKVNTSQLLESCF